MDCDQLFEKPWELPCESLENLVHLQIESGPDVCLWSLDVTLLNKNLRCFSYWGDIQIEPVDIDYGFPKLKTLLMRDYYEARPYSSDPNIHAAFRYLCENSHELEEICFAGIFENKEDYNNVTKAIGYLRNRPSLRELTIVSWENSNSKLFNVSIMELFNCPVQKPLLRKLVLNFNYSVQNLSLSSLCELVNGNYNLESLVLHGMDGREETLLQDLITILNSDHGLKEVRFTAKTEGIDRWILTDDLAKRFDENSPKICRDEFPKFIEELKSHVQQIADKRNNCAENVLDNVKSLEL